MEELINKLSEEEKKAIELVKEDIEVYKQKGLWKENSILVKALRTVLNLIEKQQEQLQEKDKIIIEMAKFIEDEISVDEFCNKENCYADEYVDGHCQKCLNCIIEYFTKKAREV